MRFYQNFKKKCLGWKIWLKINSFSKVLTLKFFDAYLVFVVKEEQHLHGVKISEPFMCQINNQTSKINKGESS